MSRLLANIIRAPDPMPLASRYRGGPIVIESPPAPLDEFCCCKPSSLLNDNQRSQLVPDFHDGEHTGIENARPETKAAGQPRVDVTKLPFDPREFIKSLPGWENFGENAPD